MNREIVLILLISSILTLKFQKKQNLPPQTPIIGIYTQTYLNTSTQKSTYIPASYVKFIQMAGAQVVPIYAFSEPQSILNILKKINGVLFTGGQMDIDINTRWTKNADTIFKYAKQQNQQGNSFPILGICQGFQLLAYLSVNYDSNALTRVHGNLRIVEPINFVSEGYLFHTLNPTQKEKLSKGNGLMYFNHNLAVTLNYFNTNIQMKNFWNLIATGITPQNEKFVSCFQSKKYPFYAVQFHPQKNSFEWKVYADRSLQGIQIPQIISNRFVQVARKSKNEFQTVQQFMNSSIYNFHTQPTTQSFTQVYVFNQIPRL